MRDEEIRKAVREKYGEIAKGGKKAESSLTEGCCGPQKSDVKSCGCSPSVVKEEDSGRPDELSKSVGYSAGELAAIPEGANLGLGCGNPTALASLKKGETVLDLGAGGGIDCFLAADIVGPKGRAIGVDMTSEMIERARENARKGDYGNVEFRLGEIENLPVADNSIDAVISNCVINLSTNKSRVFQEAHRVLKPGGRMMISDMVLQQELPEAIKGSIEAYIGCVAGALLKKDYLKAIESAGFRNVRVVEETSFPVDAVLNDPMARTIIESAGLTNAELARLVGSVKSVRVQGYKPG